MRNIITKKRIFPNFVKSNLKRCYRGTVVERAGDICCGSFSINSAAKISAGMSSEADWNTVQGCRIRFTTINLSAAFALLRKTSTVPGRREAALLILSIFTRLSGHHYEAKCMHHVPRRDFSSQASLPDNLASLIMFLWDKTINVLRG